MTIGRASLAASAVAALVLLRSALLAVGDDGVAVDAALDGPGAEAGASATAAAAAARFAGDAEVELYFGVGCFWHVQHEFVELERSLLGREGAALTALVGYAGGTRVGRGGEVCYDNYEELGHTEVGPSRAGSGRSGRSVDPQVVRSIRLIRSIDRSLARSVVDRGWVW